MNITYTASVPPGAPSGLTATPLDYQSVTVTLPASMLNDVLNALEDDFRDEVLAEIVSTASRTADKRAIKQAIKEGKIYADPIQFPDRIGRLTGEAILKYFQGEPVAPQILIPTQLYRKADAEKELKG